MWFADASRPQSARLPLGVQSAWEEKVLTTAKMLVFYGSELNILSDKTCL